MMRLELKHFIRAASTIANDGEFIIIDSQFILGQFLNAPTTLRMSMEMDVSQK